MIDQQLMPLSSFNRQLYGSY